VQAVGLQLLARRLRERLRPRGVRVLVVGPAGEMSAKSMSLTLKQGMEVVQVDEEAFSIAGTPADCALAALCEPNGLTHLLQLAPILMVSGVNAGPNLSTDVLYSGTVGAARQAAFLGVPAIATSLADYSDSEEDVEGAVTATLEVVEAVLALLAAYDAMDHPRNFPRNWGVSTMGHTHPATDSSTANRSGNNGDGSVGAAVGAEAASVASLSIEEQVQRSFVTGDCLLNVNVPPQWGGKFSVCSLGVMYYHGVLRSLNEAGEEMDAERSARLVPKFYTNRPKECRHVPRPDEKNDVDEVVRHRASISLLQTWPQGYHSSLTDEAFHAVNVQEDDGLPRWLAAPRPAAI